MRHSEKFEKVKKYYAIGAWSASMVRNAVDRWITAREAEEILRSVSPSKIPT